MHIKCKIPRPQSSLANNPVNLEKHENPDLLEKGLNLLLSISDRVEEMKVKRDKKLIQNIIFISRQVKSTTNLCNSNETDKRSPLTPKKFKKERSLSVNSYLLSPPPTTPKKSSGSSASTSPRNMSLPGNKIFCFPPTFSNDLHPPGSYRKFSINSDGSRPLSRKTSGTH